MEDLEKINEECILPKIERILSNNLIILDRGTVYA